MKSRQAAKIRELRQSLIDAGFVTLDQQSEALGLARSTTWTILRASHKGSALSAAVINRMLLSPELPPLARRKILEYTTDKLAGAYGGSRLNRTGRKAKAVSNICHLCNVTSTRNWFPGTEMVCACGLT